VQEISTHGPDIAISVEDEDDEKVNGDGADA
jgi:hypothetical protein